MEGTFGLQLWSTWCLTLAHQRPILPENPDAFLFQLSVQGLTRIDVFDNYSTPGNDVFNQRVTVDVVISF